MVMVEDEMGELVKLIVARLRVRSSNNRREQREYVKEMEEILDQYP